MVISTFLPFGPTSDIHELLRKKIQPGNIESKGPSWLSGPFLMVRNTRLIGRPQNLQSVAI